MAVRDVAAERAEPIVDSLARIAHGAKVKRELQAVAIHCILDVGNLRYRWRDLGGFTPDALKHESDPRACA